MADDQLARQLRLYKEVGAAYRVGCIRVLARALNLTNEQIGAAVTSYDRNIESKQWKDKAYIRAWSKDIQEVLIQWYGVRPPEPTDAAEHHGIDQRKELFDKWKERHPERGAQARLEKDTGIDGSDLRKWRAEKIRRWIQDRQGNRRCASEVSPTPCPYCSHHCHRRNVQFLADLLQGTALGV